MNKRKKVLAILFIMLAIIGEQDCYADNPDKRGANNEGSYLSIYNNRKTPIDANGVSIVGYVPLTPQEDIRITMQGKAADSLHPDALTHIVLIIENLSEKLFRLDSIFPKRLFVNNDYIVQKNFCKELGVSKRCIFAIDGTMLPADEINSGSSIKVLFIDGVGSTNTRIVRPWPPILLSPTYFDFSQKQTLHIRNIYPDSLEVIEIREILNPDDKFSNGFKINHSCREINSDEVCDIEIPPQVSGNQGIFRCLAIKYKMNYSVREDRFSFHNILTDSPSNSDYDSNNQDQDYDSQISSNQERHNTGIEPAIQIPSESSWYSSAFIAAGVGTCIAVIAGVCYTCYIGHNAIANQPRVDGDQQGRGAVVVGGIVAAAAAAALEPSQPPPPPAESLQQQPLQIVALVPVVVRAQSAQGVSAANIKRIPRTDERTVTEGNDYLSRELARDKSRQQPVGRGGPATKNKQEGKPPWKP